MKKETSKKLKLGKVKIGQLNSNPVKQAMRGETFNTCTLYCTVHCTFGCPTYEC